MPVIKARTDRGEILEITLLRLFSMLRDERSFGAVHSRLLRHGTVRVDLKGDQSATIHYADPKPQHNALARPRREYMAEVQLEFHLPASIRLFASHPEEVRTLIRDTINGAIDVPHDFAVHIDGDDVEAFFTNLEINAFNEVKDVSFGNIFPLEKISSGSAAS